ncbi:MAG: hypothetical protein ABI171_19680 [Collimonas sp.]|uniref:hypothetical protein n=1 Tax=Collimonas sp. TaxID=1963772 RepID=UPI0032666EFC
MNNQKLKNAQSRTERLANALSVTVEELEGVSHEIIGDSDDNGMLCGYVVQFSSNAPARVLDKIKGLDAENRVYVPASLVDLDAQSV